MENKYIYILGVGYNTPQIIELVELNGFVVKGLYNYDLKKVDVKNTLGYPVLGDYSELFNLDSVCDLKFALSMGNNKIRKDLFDKLKQLGASIPTLIHPDASVSKYAIVSEEGVIIHANSTVQATAKIGANTVISYNSGVTHTASIGAHCYIANSTAIGAYCIIEDLVFIGMGSTVVSGKVPRIGSGAYIGAGSLVLSEIPANSLAFGSPAKIVK